MQWVALVAGAMLDGLCNVDDDDEESSVIRIDSRRGNLGTEIFETCVRML